MSCMHWEDLLKEFANRTRKLVMNMADIISVNVSVRITQRHTIDDALCYKVDLVGDCDKNLGFLFSEAFCLNMSHSMTGKKSENIDELVKSSMQEFCNLASGKIAGAIAAAGTPCDIGTPVLVPTKRHLPYPEDIILVSTKRGGMAIVIG